MTRINFDSGALIKSADVNANFTELYNGTGLATNAITKGTNVFNVTGSVQAIAAGAGMTDVTGATGTLVTTGGDLLMNLTFSSYKTTNGGWGYFRVVFGASTYFWPDGTGYHFYFNALSQHMGIAYSGIKAGVAAGTYTVKLQMQCLADSINSDTGDYFQLTVVELKK